MAKIHITREHDHGLEAARAKVEEIARYLHGKYGAHYVWKGDTLAFSHIGISGHITVTAEALDLIVKPGLLFSPMTGQIEKRIAAKVDETLARGAR